MPFPAPSSSRVLSALCADWHGFGAQIAPFSHFCALSGKKCGESLEERTPQPEVRTIMPVKKKKVRKDSNKKKKQRQGKWPEITIIAGIIIFLLLIIWILI